MFTKLFAYYLPSLLFKDTYSLNSLYSLLKSDSADPTTFAIFIFQYVCPNHDTSHAEYFFQFLPANLVIQLEDKWYWKYEKDFHQKTASVFFHFLSQYQRS